MGIDSKEDEYSDTDRNYMTLAMHPNQGGIKLPANPYVKASESVFFIAFLIL
jgi:hypothetical protein